ncbi:phage tail protein [Burkholderia cepacia]|nr:phage tail protein [Burkholderia cepacia]
MGVPVASASATFTADEVVVETALGGAAFRIANFNKTINLATTGAGGMDTGSAPVSGFVALYAIYNPTTGASALLARNATSAVQPNVYGGGNMPAGYTASALVSVWQTTSGGLLNVGSQFDRVISTPGFTVLSTTTQAGSYTSFSISGGVPPNAKTARGYQSITGNTASAGLSSSIAGSASGIGAAGQAATMPTSSASVTTPFPHIPLVTPQTLYYLAAASSGTLTFVVGVYEYTF